MRIRAPGAVALALLACHCGGAVPLQRVRVAGEGYVVPFGKSESLERAALVQRAAKDLGCDAPVLERSRTPLPIFRASGCGKHRVYLRAVRGYLPGGPGVEVRVVDFVDVARADPRAPFAGVPRLPGEVETSPFPDRFDDSVGATVDGDGWDAALEGQALRDRLALDVLGARTAGCAREDVVPWHGEFPRWPAFVEACGKFLYFGRVGVTTGLPHEEEPWQALQPYDWDERHAAVGFVPWVASPLGHHGPNAVMLHVTADDPGLVAIGEATRSSPSEYRLLCQPPCDLSVDGTMLFRASSAPRTSVIRPSDPFRLPEGRGAVTAHVAPARHSKIILGSVLLSLTPLAGLSAGLTFSEASPGTARNVAGGGLIATTVALAVIGLLFVLDTTSVTVE